MNSTSVRSVKHSIFSLYGFNLILMLFVGAILAFAFPHTAFVTISNFSDDVDGASLTELRPLQIRSQISFLMRNSG